LPAVVGIAIGIVEAYFVYEDEPMAGGKQFLGDMFHGLLFAAAGVLVASNVPWILSMGIIPSWIEGILMVGPQGISPVVCGLIAVIMLVKMVGSHAVKGVSSGGFTEKFWHKLVVALAVGFSPYLVFPLYGTGFLMGLKEAVPWLPF
jgi:hypothetical protein